MFSVVVLLASFLRNAAPDFKAAYLIMVTVCEQDLRYRGDEYVCAEYYRDFPIVVRKIGGRYIFEVYDNDSHRLVSRFGSAQAAYSWIDEMVRWR